MQAVVFNAPEKMQVTTVPDPACGPQDVIVKVAAAGICGTDTHIYHNEYYSTFPLIAGHEFCGRIVETGKEVTDFRVGDRVAVDPNLYCGHCQFCRNLEPNQCSNLKAVGVDRDGAFAEFVAAPQQACYRLPDSMTDSQGAFVEPVSCVVQSLKRLHVAPGDAVLILGAGPMGLVLTQALRHRGASKVVVVEKQADRLQLAAKLGATATVAAGPDQAAALSEQAPLGFNIVIDATGVPKVIEGAFDYLAPRGQYLQFGVAPNGATVSVKPYDIFKKDWTIIGSFACAYTFDPAIAWLANGVIDVRPLVSDTVPLSQFPSAFSRFMAGQTLKVHLLPRKIERG